MTIDTDRWQVCNGKSIDTDSDHMSLYGDVVRRALQCNAAMCYILQCIIIMVALC